MGTANRGSPGRSSSRRKNKTPAFAYLFLGALTAFICVSITAFALYISGYIPFGLSSNLTATAIAQNNASCQALIDRAIQASGNSCGGTGANQVCYGNTTIKAELAPDSTRRFSERGDTLAINELYRLSASPLRLNTNEWGIAVFKVLANLPRSLPGETVTMVVFGDATLENQSGNLESFYFTSELGQIACKKVPYDGLLINTSEGGGIRFNINGAELTLMGTASIKAIRNGTMEVSVYRGSGRLVSNGQEQYFGAGQKVSTQLGGANGNQSISEPSTPQPLTPDELSISCTMTGQFCSQSEIVPVSEAEAQGQIHGQITSTPTLIPTQTLTPTPSATTAPVNTSFVLPTWTASKAPATFTPTRTSTPTKTAAPVSTSTYTPAPSSTPTMTPSFTMTPSLTTTPSFTSTPSGPTEPLCPSVSLSPLTTPNPNNLGTDITNSSGGPITINRFFAYWVKSPASQKLDKLFLGGNPVWNISDTTPPSDLPTEGNWMGGADLTIPIATTQNFVVEFQNDLQPTGYKIHLIFDIGCQVIGTK